ncbi:HAD family hydrolase [Parvibaculum sp. MBR-TMA-1.3b-4.2]
MVRCLMLDVDGVVVTGRPEDGRSWATDIERDLGIAPDALHAHFFAPHWGDIVIGRKPLLDALAESLPALSSSVTAQDFIDYWFEKDARLDKAVLAACDELRGRGINVFLATNQEHMRAAYLMDRLALRDHVDGIIYSAGIAARKPDRAFFDAAEKISGAAPHDILLVDDTRANIDAALDAGWTAVHWAEESELLPLLESE